MSRDDDVTNLIQPIMGKIAVVAVTTSSARTDLSAAAQLGTVATAGCVLAMKAETSNCWFFFNNANAGTASKTETGAGTPANRTFYITAGETQYFKLRANATWLVVIGDVAGYLRIYPIADSGSVIKP